jgi:hypothetical protein
MSTGNHELGAFDRAVQASQQSDRTITEAGKAVITTTAYHWMHFGNAQ